MKKIILMLAFVSFSFLTSRAQSGTNSPYSQFGLGVLAEQGSGFNRGMNGVGIGFHESNQANYLNPASYANIDSLTFLFDAGASLQLTNFSENGRKMNVRNANFDYVVGSFRIYKNVGLAFGILPYSNVGYKYGDTNFIDADKQNSYSTSYYGNGGIHEVFVGVGAKPIKGLSVGLNLGYVWGDINRQVTNSYSDSYINTMSRYYTASPTGLKLDLGVQYTAKVDDKNSVTLGATFTPGMKMGGDVQMRMVSNNSQTAIADTTTFSQNGSLFIPTKYGVGLAWYHSNNWRVGVDYTLTKWTDKPFPVYANGNYILSNNALMDRHRIILGGEYVPNPMRRSYFQRVHYRAGVSYATPYIKVNGQDGPKEISASIGFGLPITNNYNNRSILNISAQWCRNAATGLITENIFRINIGLTFNERWFMKWKLE